MVENDLYDNIVVKSNALIQASYSMTVNEQRLLLACISQIDSRKRLSTSGPFTITVDQARQLFYSQGDYGHIYRDIEDACERLFERKARITLPDDKELLTRFVQSVKFEPRNAQVVIHFAEAIIPYLSQLEEKFTKYRLLHMIQLTNTYAIRIYELLVCWSSQNKYSKKEIEIDELRKILKIDDKYKQFSQLRYNIFNPAIEQINKVTDFDLEITYRKHERAYKWAILSFKRKPSAIAAEEALEAKNKLAHAERVAAKEKRLQAEATAANNAIKESNTSDISIMLAAIPDGTKYMTKIGNEYEKRGDWFESDGGVIPASTAIEMIRKGNMTPIAEE